MKRFLLPLALASSAAVSAHASTIIPTISRSAGTSYQTAALTGFSTTSLEMVGSTVSVTFANGVMDSATWAAAGAIGSGWSLTVNGDTYSSPFTLLNSGTLTIRSFLFDGVLGNTLFDTISDMEDSPNSAIGEAMTNVIGPSGLTVSTLYTNQLLVGGTFYGDAYTRMIVTLGGTGLTGSQNLSFLTDTDNAVASSGITPVPVAITPEPSTFVLLGTAIAGVAYVARRRFAIC